MPRLFDDRFGGAIGLANTILRRDVVMLEVGDEDGIMYAEGIEPNGVAVVHIFIWNRRNIPDLDSLITSCAVWAFSTFQLRLLSAWIPEHNLLARKLLTRLGWVQDGIIRLWLRFDGQLEDCYVFSLSPEEAAWAAEVGK